jgi:hypothetical protein
MIEVLESAYRFTLGAVAGGERCSSWLKDRLTESRDSI